MRLVEPSQALADLTEISSQIEAAVIVQGGTVAAATIADARRAEEVAQTGRRLLEEAGRVRPAGRADEVVQLEVATLEGSVFVVRDGDRTVVATTGQEPTVGLVFYDLKSCLRALAHEEASAAS